MKFFDWISFWVKKPGCEHKRFTRRQWFSPDGTPMVYFNCWDCGYNDQSHVHGDPEQMRKDGWEKKCMEHRYEKRQ